MPTLSVPGAVLDYITLGHSGPPLLLIPGAPGHHKIFSAILQPLSTHFKVTTYTRRGYSLSHLTGPQDYSSRLSRDAADAAALITHLGGNADVPFYVFGTSSGAIVAHELVIGFPHLVRELISHEPPALALLPPQYRDQATAGFKAVYDVYRQQGVETALTGFVMAAAASEEEIEVMKGFMDPDASADARADAMYFLERELLVYTTAEVDVEGLRGQREKIVPCLSRAAVGKPAGAPTEVLSGVLGVDALVVEGGHVGYVTHVEEFVGSLRRGFGV